MLNAYINLVRFVIIAVVAVNLPSANAQQHWTRIFNAEINGFNTPSAFLGGIENSWPEFVDIDSDGDYDLAVGSQNGELVFLINSGTPITPEWSITKIQLSGLNVDLGRRMVSRFVDIDNDNDFDLFLRADGFQKFIFFRNIGDSTNPIFQKDDEFCDISSCFSVTGFYFADLDNDNDLDLFQGFGTNVIYYENIGKFDTARFVLTDSTYLDGNHTDIMVPVFVDIDNDNDYDMFIGKWDGTLSFFRNLGTPTESHFLLVTDNYINLNVEDEAAPAFADIDNDGDYDMFVGADGWLTAGRIYKFENVGTSVNAEWEFDENFLPYLDFGTNSYPTFGDIDNDGDLDLLVGWGFPLTKGFALLRNVGDKFTPKWDIESWNWEIESETIGRPILYDIDNDGDLDLFQSRHGKWLQYFKNEGTPEVPNWVLQDSNLIEYEMGLTAVVKVEFADIDGDGDGDIIGGTAMADFGGIGGRLVMAENIGTPEEAKYDTMKFYTDIKVGNWSLPSLGDVDADGDLDLLVADARGGYEFYRNQGDASNPVWELETDSIADIPNLLEAMAVFVDIDGDGDDDLFIGEQQAGIYFYRNDFITSLVDEENNPINSYILLTNYPNPFNSRTTIGYEILQSGYVELTLYDIRGREIMNLYDGYNNPGSFELT